MSPHCEWTVFIDPDADEVTEPDITRVLSSTRLAGVVIERPVGSEPVAWTNYSGPVYEQLQLEQLSHAALVVVCSELAVQVHLLIAGLMLSSRAALWRGGGPCHWRVPDDRQLLGGQPSTE